MADPQIHARAIHREACFVAPSPELAERWKADLAGLRGGGVGSDIASVLAIARQPRPLGFDDGVTDQKVAALLHRVLGRGSDGPEPPHPEVGRNLER